MRIEFNNVKAVVSSEHKSDDIIYQDVRRHTKVLAPGVRYMPSHIEYMKSKGKSGWNGMVNILKENGEFPTGLLPLVLQNLWSESKCTPSLVDKRFVPKYQISSVDKVNLFNYQVDAFNDGLTNKFNNMWWPRGIYELATGSGKTELAIAMYEFLPVRTLFIVTRKSLAYQAKERFESYGYQPACLFDGQWESTKYNLGNGPIVATIQSILSQGKDPKIQFLLQNIEQVFFDEAHLIAASIAKGNQLVNASNLLDKAFFRWGLTATPFLKDSYSNWLLAGSTGNVLHSIKSKKLIDMGYLVPPKITMIEVPEVFKCPNKWPACYNDGIIMNRARTRITIEKLASVPSPAMVLVNLVSHAEILQREARKQGVKTEMLIGMHTQEERDRALARLDRGGIHAIITTLFSIGFDYPNLRSLGIANGGKSSINSIQRIGRGLRKAKGKTEVIVFDFMDRSSKILTRHSNARKNSYKEQGFEVKVEKWDGT